jgi:hypothetical protein
MSHRAAAEDIHRLVAARKSQTAPAKAILLFLSNRGFGSDRLPASSGKTRRHRLNRGGDRDANCALYRIVMARQLLKCIINLSQPGPR